MKLLSAIDENKDVVSKEYVDNETPINGLKPICAVGSDTSGTSGWYKVASSTLSGWGNQNLLYYIKGGYSNGYAGILELEFRSDNTSISCWQCKWVARNPNLGEDKVIITINGMTWTMYVYNPTSQYGRIYFTEISDRNITGSTPNYTITYYNNNTTPESSAPTATITSSDGFAVLRAKQDGDGNVISSSYIKNSGTYINTHPENTPVVIPFIHNDISFLKSKGGNYTVEYDGVAQTQNIDNAFDGSPSYWAINPTGTTEIVITLTLHKTFTWTNTIYIDFGAVGWRSKNVKVEVINTNYSQDVWTSKLNITNNNSGNVKTTFNHVPVGADNAGAGFNKVRFTFSSWNSATIFRIAQLGIYNYGSQGVRETFMSRGIDDAIYRNITPNSDNVYNLGSSSKKWANIYATNLYGNLTGNVTGTASKATGDKNGDDITTTYYKASNPNGYTSNTGTITGINMNGASKGTSGVVDLGTVLTSHQSIKTVNNNTMTGTGNVSVGTITKVQANGTDVASSGTANIPAASTSAYGVTKLSNATDSTSEVLAATPKAVKAAYDLAAGKGTGTITGVSVNGTSVATSGVANITSVPASILSGAIKNGVTATTQSAGDNSTKVATTAYVDTAITNLPEPMIFKGSLGTGGTITTLPTASSSNEGYTYKVITAGTYASQSAKVGDTFISDGSSWVLIPSGDEPSGTVTSVTLKATSPIAIDSESAITSSGTRTLSHANSGVTAGTYKSVTVNATGHVTGGTNPTTLSGYGITDAKINNGTITLGSNTITPLTSFTETDPVFSASAAAGITSSNITAWNAAEANVQSDWNQTTTTADDYIKNKPTNVSSFTNDANYVTNTDYAVQGGDAGVVKINYLYGVDVNNSGQLRGYSFLYDGYGSANSSALISKGTLENVIAAKKWLTKNETNGSLWNVGLTSDGHLYYESGSAHADTTLANLSELSTKQNTILSGTTDPSSSLGSNGDVYIKIDTTT